MERPTQENSDSDSSESWTLLEKSNSQSETIPELLNLSKRETVDTHEDSDGISIITDSETESLTPCENLDYDDTPIRNSMNPSEHNENIISTISFNSVDNHYDLNRSNEEFLDSSSRKLKTYVHKRNKKLSMVLNILVLGSVITAAGVALGHMWGVKDDCAYTTSSVNKILSNLYKLQEENVYLRGKIKELTIANNNQMQHRKYEMERNPIKINKFKQKLEVPLNEKKTEQVIHNDIPVHEKQYITDLDKLKSFYKQNRSWLDVEVAKRLNQEKITAKKIKDPMKIKGNISLKNQNLEVIDENTKPDDICSSEPKPPLKEPAEKLNEFVKKISYADSLKTNINPFNKARKIEKRSYREAPEPKKPSSKKQTVENNSFPYFDDISESNLIKEDTHAANLRYKQAKKKQERQKSNKKQKRRNKYEQWEMKSGYKQEYDDISCSSAETVSIKKSDKKLVKDVRNKSIQTDSIPTDKGEKMNDKMKSNDTLKEDSKDNWQERRAVLRKEARRKVERAMFDESSPNNASWYFRRMQKREQCRGKTPSADKFNRRGNKRNMNFKSKR